MSANARSASSCQSPTRKRSHSMSASSERPWASTRSERVDTLNSLRPKAGATFGTFGGCVEAAGGRGFFVMDKPAKPDRTLVVVLIVIAALVVVALVVVFSRRTPKLLDASTPAGVVQRYSATV